MLYIILLQPGINGMYALLLG